MKEQAKKQQQRQSHDWGVLHHRLFLYISRKVLEVSLHRPQALQPRHAIACRGFSLTIMPTAAPRPCTHPGCPVLVRDGSGRCAKHVRAEAKQLDRQRGSANERGYTYAWQRARESFLRDHPLCQCQDCDEGRVRVTAATVVDHKIPHRGNMTLFWDRANWQSMSKVCHDRKTATMDSGFARRSKG